MRTEVVVIDQDKSTLGDVRISSTVRIAGGPESCPPGYRIQENRILKNGELRYYDHPKFGVLAKVTRVEERKRQRPAMRTTRVRSRVAVQEIRGARASFAASATATSNVTVTNFDEL